MDGFKGVPAVAHGEEIDPLPEIVRVLFLKQVDVPAYYAVGWLVPGFGHPERIREFIAVKADGQLKIILHQEVHVFLQQQPVGRHGELSASASHP